MLNRKYINFLALIIFHNRAKYLWITFIATTLIALISSMFFITASIKRDISFTLTAQPDFIVQKYRAGKVEDIPLSWLDEFSDIKGVSKIVARVYGMHFYEPSEKYFMIVGIDLFDRFSLKSFKKIFDTLDVADFLSRDNMIVGRGVKELFDYYEYRDYYNFRPPDRSIQKVYIYDVFDKDAQIITNDIALMDINLAKKILGIEDEYSTDAAIYVANELELDMIKEKLIISHFNMRIISKEEIAKGYENLYNYKGGIFLALFILSLVTFLLILYQRYSTILHSDVKEISILRRSGWSIGDVIFFKLSENFIIAFSAYIMGVVVAYIYVYILDAPLIKEIFLGFNNLNNRLSFTPAIEISTLFIIFLIFIVPFMLSVVIPVWRSQSQSHLR